MVNCAHSSRVHFAIPREFGISLTIVCEDNHLAQQVFLSRLSKPSAYDLAFLRSWLQDPKHGNFPLLGLDRHLWDDQSDLIAVSHFDGNDIFSRWVRGSFLPSFHRLLKRVCKKFGAEESQGISQYRDESIHTAVNAVVTVISSLFPIIVVVLLYYVQSMPAKLGCIAGFTALCSLTLTLVTHASRVEIFAATTA
jgi:hypothetical protein